MFPRPKGLRRRQPAISRETRILAAREIDIGREIEYVMATLEVREGCFWTLEERKATAHPAFPADEITRTVAAVRRG